MRLRHRDQTEEFWPAYTDILMVTALILIFVVLGLILINTQNLAKAEIVHRQQLIRKAFEDSMGAEIKTKKMEIVDVGERQDITFADSLLFDKGSDKLKPLGIATMTKVARVLAAKQQSTFYELHVEGHTDIDPIRSSQFRSNWHLSSSRATSVVEFLTKHGINPWMTTLSASGYGEFQRIDTGKSEVAKAKNRRIAITLGYPVDRIEDYLNQMSKK